MISELASHFFFFFRDRYFLLGNIIVTARRILADHRQHQGESSAQNGEMSPGLLPADSPLRGYTSPGLAEAHAACRVDSADASSPPRERDWRTPKRKKRKKLLASKGGVISRTSGDTELDKRKVRGGEEDMGTLAAVDAPMELAELGGRLAQLLMVVRMVEEQSDLTAFYLPVNLSVPGSLRRRATQKQLGVDPSGHPTGRAEGGDASSSESEDDGEEDHDDDDNSSIHMSRKAASKWGKAGMPKKGKEKDNATGSGKAAGKETGKRKFAIEQLKYHKKVCCVACYPSPFGS